MDEKSTNQCDLIIAETLYAKTSAQFVAVCMHSIQYLSHQKLHKVSASFLHAYPIAKGLSSCTYAHYPLNDKWSSLGYDICHFDSTGLIMITTAM